MATTTEAHGICLYCEDADTCTHHQGRVVVECADFRPVTFPPGFGVDRSVALHHPDAAGLCATCTNLPLCGLPRPVGGVWHCENYNA